MTKHHYSTPRRLQKGASLLEGIAYLGIAAIVVIGAIALLNTAFSSANSNELNSELSAIQTASRKLFMTTQGNYGAADFTATLISAKGFPQTLSTTDTTVSNAWGGAVTVAPDATTNTEFDITYTAVPVDVCVNALTSTTTGWISVTGPGDNTPYPPPISPATAKTACGTTAGKVIWISN
ncbi:type 4 pilus major pilin [Trinickia acidisoli]|uniref:type 4 pilus major pilin n=1 Tax=Trinickia acidisoli TaxID=2767482 RepID=UPI001A903240|nr:type 4 pilus major pilin [Trinickia acidisoli]